MNRGLKIGGRLDRYVGASFVSSYATAFLILVGLFVILDMASNLDEYLRTWKDGSKPPIGLIVRYYVLNLPFVFLQVAPFVTLVAGMFTASRLHKHSEITASLSAGVGLHRLFAPVLLGAVLSGWIMFELRETLGTTLGRQRDAVKYVLDRQQYDEVYFELWLRDLNLNLSASVGFIALFGVAVLNGLVWVSAAEHIRRRGLDPHFAAEKTAMIRLRPGDCSAAKEARVRKAS